MLEHMTHLPNPSWQWQYKHMKLSIKQAPRIQPEDLKWQVEPSEFSED